MSVYNTYFCEYKMLPEHTTRENCMTFFGGMTAEDDKKELKNVTLLGRWACVGGGRGFCVAIAKSNKDIQEWLTNWVTMADIKVMPCLDDNQQRMLILGTQPKFMVEYKNVDAEPLENESLYFIKYKFKDNAILEGFKAFAAMTEEEDKFDSGNCTPYGRWHIPSEGIGYAIVSSLTVKDVYEWAYNWSAMCECNVIPVTGDNDTRNIIQNCYGFDVKYNQLMQQLSKLQQPVDNDCCLPNHR